MEDIVCNVDLKNTVTSLEEIHSDFEGYVTKLESACQNIEEAWSGYDATLYINKMREDYKTLFEDFNKCLESYIDFLKTVYPAYETVDNHYANEDKIEIG